MCTFTDAGRFGQCGWCWFGWCVSLMGWEPVENWPFIELWRWCLPEILVNPSAVLGLVHRYYYLKLWHGVIWHRIEGEHADYRQWIAIHPPPNSCACRHACPTVPVCRPQCLFSLLPLSFPPSSPPLSLSLSLSPACHHATCVMVRNDRLTCLCVHRSVSESSDSSRQCCTWGFLRQDWAELSWST